MGREGGFRGVAGSERWEERGGGGGAAEGRFAGAPACRSSSGSRVEHGSRCSFFFLLLNVCFLRPAAPSGNLEEGGLGSGGGEGGRRRRQLREFGGVLFCLFGKVIPISVNPPAG